MKIARIDTIPRSIPHEHGGPPPASGGQAWETLNILPVRVETQDGAVGWGEAFSYNQLHAFGAGDGRRDCSAGPRRPRCDRRQLSPDFR